MMRNRAQGSSSTVRYLFALFAAFALAGCGGGGGGNGSGGPPNNSGPTFATLTGTVITTNDHPTAAASGVTITVLGSNPAPSATIGTVSTFTIFNVPTTATQFTVTIPESTAGALNNYYKHAVFGSQSGDGSVITFSLPAGALVAGQTYTLADPIQISGATGTNDPGPPPPPNL